MKYYAIVITGLLAAGCHKKNEITFNGTAPGLKNGVFIVKTLGDSTVYGENIKDGKFPEKKHLLKEPGYYSMNITDEDNNDKHEPFEVYLESGTYTITTEPGKLYLYPKITSASKTQQELSASCVLVAYCGWPTYSPPKGPQAGGPQRFLAQGPFPAHQTDA